MSALQWLHFLNFELSRPKNLNKAVGMNTLISSEQLIIRCYAWLVIVEDTSY